MSIASRLIGYIWPHLPEPERLPWVSQIFAAKQLAISKLTHDLEEAQSQLWGVTKRFFECNRERLVALEHVAVLREAAEERIADGGNCQGCDEEEFAGGCVCGHLALRKALAATAPKPTTETKGATET